MSPLDAAMLRLARACLPLLSPRLAERALRAERDPAVLEDGELERLAGEVDRLAVLLTKAALREALAHVHLHVHGASL